MSVLLAALLPAPATYADADVSRSALESSRATGFVLAEFPDVLSMGTGFCVDSAGLFVTTHHVISHDGQYGRIHVVLAAGTLQERILNATIVKADAELDLALLRVDRPAKLESVELADGDGIGQLHENQEVLVLGYPVGLDVPVPASFPQVSVSTGQITVLRNQLAEIQFDASINQDDSGGPLLDQHGHVIGVVSAIAPDEQINGAISVSRLRVLLAEAHLVIAPPELTDRALAAWIAQQWLSPARGRQTPPDENAQQASLKLVHELFAADYADKSKPSTQRLIYKLLDEAQKQKDDPAGRYALLSEAREAAIRAGDFEAALHACEELTETYDLMPKDVIIDLLHRIGPHLSGQDAADGAAVSLVLIEALAQKQAFSHARKWIASTRAIAAASHNSKVNAAIAERIERVEFQASETEAAQAALAKLRTDPNNPAANLAAGRYECFIRGDFAAGCLHLAHGSNRALQAAGAAELAKPTAPDALRACGDLWWELASAQAATPVVAEACKARAAYWYRRAEPKLAGLAQQAVIQRLKELEPQPEEPAIQPRRFAGKVVNHTKATEAQAVVHAIAEHYPWTLPAAGTIELLKVHDAREFHCSGDAGKQKTQGTYSLKAVGGQCVGVPMLWGIYEQWPAGRYLIVYRVQALTPVSGKNVCFLDVCTGGNTIASHRPDAAEFTTGQWACMPVQLNLPQPQNLEFRLWSQSHPIVVDRVYVFGIR